MITITIPDWIVWIIVVMLFLNILASFLKIIELLIQRKTRKLRVERDYHD